jgi:conjugal transfer ATP-binding protein TraC
MLNNLNTLIAKIPEYCGLRENSEEQASLKVAAAELVSHSTNGARPLADYLSYRYFDEKEKLFFNDGDYIGFCLEISPIVGVDDGLLKNLQYFFNDELPQNSFMQFLLIASHEVEPILNWWEQARVNLHPVIKSLTQRRRQFIKQMAVNFKNFDGRIARDYRLYLNFSQKLESNSSNIKKVQIFRQQLLNKLRTLQLGPKACGAEELMQVVREILQMEINSNLEACRYDKLNLLSSQILKPLQPLLVKDESLVHQASNLVSKCYFAKELPEEFSLHQTIGLLGSSENAMLGIPGRFIISYVVANDLNQGEQAAILSKGDRTLQASEQWYSRNDRDIKRDALEWRHIIDRTKNKENLLTESFSVMLTAPLECIDIAEQNLISLYNTYDFRLSLNTNLQLPSVLAILPMQQGIFWPVFKNYYLTRICLSDEVVARLPLHAEWKGMPKPGILLQARRGQLFSWNPFYRIASGNYNVTVFGPSGGGKSVFLQELCLCMQAQNVKLFILDIGQSFANIARLLSGEVIQFNKDAVLALNPFASLSSSMLEEDRIDFIRCTKEILSVMCSVEEDAHGSAELEKAILQALEESNYTLDITSFAKSLEKSTSEKLRRYGATLYSYTKDGLYGKYFSSRKAATFMKQMTVFEFEEIKNDPRLLAILLQILLLEITKQFLTGDRSQPFMLIIDEAWMLLDFTAKFFASLGRTVRKYGGSLVVCVQNYMDLQKTIDHRTILENSTWTVMLKQDEKGLEAFKNSEAFKDMVPLIQSISLSPGKYSELLLYSTGVRVIGRLVLDDYAKILYSTDAADFNYLRNATKQGIDLDEAIENLIAKKRSQEVMHE